MADNRDDFQFKIETPEQGPQKGTELGILGNVGTGISLLGALGGDPNLSQFGQGLLGIQQRNQQLEFDKLQRQFTGRQSQKKVQDLQKSSTVGFQRAERLLKSKKISDDAFQSSKELFELGKTKEATAIINSSLKFDRSLRQFQKKADLSDKGRQQIDAFITDRLKEGQTSEAIRADILNEFKGQTSRIADRTLDTLIEQRQNLLTPPEPSLLDQAGSLIRGAAPGVKAALRFLAPGSEFQQATPDPQAEQDQRAIQFLQERGITNPTPEQLQRFRLNQN